MASGDIGKSVFFSIRQPHHKQIPYAPTFRSVNKPVAIGRRLRVIMRCAGFRICEPLSGTIEHDLKKLDALANLRGIKNRSTIDCPDRHIAAASMKIRNIQEFGHTSIASPIRKLSQARSIRLDDMGMAIVMLPRNEQQPLTIR
jgi:hypothetical protein